MHNLHLPESLHEALTTTTTAGAVGVTRLVIDGLLALDESTETRIAVATMLYRRLRGYAALWHIFNAMCGQAPNATLRQIRRDLDESARRTVDAAAAWLSERPGGVVHAADTPIVTAVLARSDNDNARSATPTTALAAAEAVGPSAVLAVRGTRRLTERHPTLVVTTSLALVPEPVFSTLGAPGFEHVPLHRFTAIAVDGEILPPEQVGRYAATIGSHK
ncbi:hypothetical protein [Nocardia carnea]|uniref:hypothetical protein n=1 Tax=Nocardia carnea TaxID=37328 RepID=UPI00245895A2|nr:hypothetical protein [Nocardia carnea]